MTTNPTIEIVAHGKDTDGIIAHALLEKLEREAHPGSEIVHHYVDYPDFEETLKGVILGIVDRNSNNSILYIADMSIEKDMKDLLRSLKRNNVPSTLIDHHSGTLRAQWEIKRYFKKFLAHGEKCTSELIFEKLVDQSSIDAYYCKYLASVAQAHDFDIPGEFLVAGETIQGLITLRSLQVDPQQELDQLVHDLAINRVCKAGFGFELRQSYLTEFKEYERIKAEECQKLEASAEPYNLPGNKTAVIGYASSWLYTKPGMTHLSRKFPDADLYVAIFDRNDPFSLGEKDVILRSSNSEWGEFVPGFCESLGGGGRANPMPDRTCSYKGGFRLDGNAQRVATLINEYLTRDLIIN